MTLSTLVNGYILGWSVAWPPGPINAEMIRRGLLPKDRGGGFWSAWPIGLGACTGDFIWAFCVSVGAGALLNSVEIRRVLAIVSLALLLFLAAHFAIGAWKIYRAHRSLQFQAPKNRRRGGFLLGVFIVLMSPWSVTFWLARYRQPARTKRKCATVPRHRGRGRSRCADLGRSFMHGGKIGRACFFPSELAGRYRSHHR